MMHSVQNRKFPVFFFSKKVLVVLSVIAVISCKSKTDWRDNYNKNKTKKSTVRTVKKKADAPKNFTEISKILDVSESTLKNKNLYNFIIDWYGTPYQFGGINEDGIDCSGFANVLYKQVYSIQLPRTSKDIAERTNRKYVKDLEEGDLVFFSFGNSGNINHVGIYLHNNMFVHASTSQGVIISNITEPYYGNYLVKSGAFTN